MTLEPELRLVEHDGRGADVAMPILELAPGRAWLDGTELRVDDPKSAVRGIQRRLERFSDTNEVGILLAIDRDTPFAELSTWTSRAAQAGASRIDLVFGKPNPVAPPTCAAEERLDALPKGEPKIGAVAELVLAAEAECPFWKKQFDGLQGVDPSMKFPLLAIGSIEATRSCRCALDLEAMRAILWNLGPGRLLEAVVTIRMAGSGLVEIRAPDHEPWSVSYRRFLDVPARGRPVRLLPQ